MRDFLETCDDNEIICFIDGYDILILEGPHEMEIKFKALCDDKMNVVISKETFTDALFSKQFQEFSHYTTFKKCKGYFLCAGTYIGYAAGLRQMYRDMCNKFSCEDAADDQRLIQSFCQEEPSRFIIDTKNDLFLVLADLFNGLSNNRHGIKIENGVFKYKDQQPSILHADGNTNIDDIIEALGYDTSLYKATPMDTMKYMTSVFKHHVSSFFQEFFYNLLYILVVFVLGFYLYKKNLIDKIIVKWARKIKVA